MELTNFLSLLAQSLLVIALPFVIAAAVQTIRVQSQRLGDERLETLKSIVQTAVQVAEQTGIVEGLTGAQKRDRAVQVAQNFLHRRGINVDLGQIVSLIEAEVLTQFNNPAMPADTPEARQALIDRAIESAVLAAEQSGLQGLIQNTGAEKKAYALRLAADYLRQHGITIPDQLASGLIEAQLLRFILAARGQLPGPATASSQSR